ncbi:longitudinals lacking protein, isoforms F/I/K/T isoform X1 [Drosophila serrata]|uniref:longitudinals lacking protein, isoforms F/I/K/T isoform X1 n=1 Tax=Drosophila serrata TaxID=7274 RepID=UPI000A1D01BF|nr:longitudinals lacking protein, isoforms F/I/K/T isoform X1 [Drosophila serrata]XP_020815246.1 longitudinals lacking protein, isoforms F/I/K/T isoform X1 [Drosophila serrata]XP_020815248.1 longitudinals lacking protein, isoforms F/I/K/T isoform X1 [Drosophila serrata]
MDDDQQFCLRWNNHQSTLISVFDTLLENETLVDCTLAAEGKFLKAHKVVLSACSPYFATLLQEQYDKHPIFILKDVKYQELRAMMDYMYRGEVNISQDQLAALLKAAESLQIKGLSDNRTGGSAPKPESTQQQHHRGKLSGAYTLEQTKRARLATGGAMDASGDVSGSREGSSSPSRRRRKVRRRSMENDAHDNSNSSVLQAVASNQSILQQTGAGLAVSALVSTQLSSGSAAGTSSQASSNQQQPLTSTNVTKKTESAKLTSSTAAPASGAAASVTAQQQQAQQQQAQTTSDAINTENVQAQSQGGAQGGVEGDDEDMDEASAVGGASAISGPNPASASASAAAVHTGVVVKQLASVVDKSSSNHKQQKIKDNSVSSVGSEMVIEPKAEYDDDAHDENVEDLTLDEEDMTMEELDQTAGTSQGGEGSSQTYAWQHDRSQDELGLMAQDAQQRDPQASSKQDKGEQTEGTPEEFELDDCLLESNDIVITQNKDGFVLHVKKLGNITAAAKMEADSADHHSHPQQQQQQQQQQQAAVTVTGPAGQPTPTITELLNAAAASHSDKPPALTALSSGTTIKLPSSECELINIKKIIPATTSIATHHHAHTSSATIIHPHHIIQHVPQETHHQEQQQQHHHHQTIHIEEVPQTSQQHHHHLQTTQPPQHTQVQSIITTHPGQTINLVGLRNVQLTDAKPISASRIRYSRGKIIGGPTVQNLQIVETHEPIQHQHHELADGTKYEISEIDLNNPNASAAIISDLVKYAEIDDIELPDGTKIGIGFAPSEITEHMQTSGGETHITTIEHDPQEVQTVHEVHQLEESQQQTHHIHTTQLQTHHIQTVVQTGDQQQQHHHHQRLELQDDDGVETILPEEMGVHDSSKSYTILTTRPMKEESDAGNDPSGMTYELSLSDSSLGPCDDPESRYVCRHCGKKYRWKSTLRRHENVECGGKEPCHPCPYCTYKAKQRGNLGVHVRKHHPEKPQLESKRGRKI